MAISTIVVAGNSNYIVPLTVCVRSIVEQMSSVHLIVLDCGLTLDDRNLLRRTAGTAVPIHFESVAEHKLGLLPSPICGSWATYARLLVGDLLVDTPTVLYLDADTMVLQDVSSLFSEELGELPIAAVREMYTPTFASDNGIANWRKLNLDPGTPYFNAGVMLINIPIWNSLHVKEWALEYLRVPDQSVCLYDQEALNFAINGKWRELAPIWNVTRYWFRPERRTGQYERIIEEAYILHFLAESK
ncbi:MAG TPA: glycosyltransferase family 8 protein, partial [Ktedonobacteraceae bacterium]|nr:glycosyltransferase family 8 protein [Ktedonobacteraceae bacterium]